MRTGPSGGVGSLDLAVVGAHLDGLPLHHELTAAGAVLTRRTETAAVYRLHLLAGDTPARPGLVRVSAGGRPIAVEVYRMPLERVGGFLAGVPAPLAVGTVELASGESVFGFVCEPIALEDAPDITEFGGWRAYVASLEFADEVQR